MCTPSCDRFARRDARSTRYCTICLVSGWPASWHSTFGHRTEPLTGGWLTSHFDVVDQFSPAERPGADRAYTHKLDFELDTAFHVFNFLPEGKWLRGVELETSLDYLATGLPKKGDAFADGARFLDNASHWSLSFVFVIPHCSVLILMTRAVTSTSTEKPDWHPF